MKELSNLLGYRDSIRVLDATLRDGGLVNEFYFTDDFVRALYRSNVKAGVDFMEMGYRSSKKLFNENEFGKWKFSGDDQIREIVGDNPTNMKLSIMADVGRCYKEDFDEKVNSPIDLVRVATYIHRLSEAIDLIEDAAKKGYRTSCNIMAVSQVQEADVRYALDVLGQTPVDVIYIVDSFGALYPEQVARIADLYLDFGAKYNKKIGMHAHNNLQLAFANTVEACEDGVDFLDGTYMSIGRAAGNCPMELLLGFLKNPKYDIYPVLQFLGDYMVKLKEDGLNWGYDLQYLINGLLNQHPRTAIAFTQEKRRDYAEYYKEMLS